MRIDTLDPVLVRWLVSRAGVFVRGPRNRRKPAWSYRELGRNLRRSRKVTLSPAAIRRLILREAPEIAQARGDAYPIAKRARLQRSSAA